MSSTSAARVRARSRTHTHTHSERDGTNAASVRSTQELLDTGRVQESHRRRAASFAAASAQGNGANAAATHGGPDESTSTHAQPHTVAPEEAAILKRGDVAFYYPPSYAENEPFSKPHTVTVLLVLLAFIIYAITNRESSDTATNVRTGVFAAIGVGLVFCAEHLRDSLFIRPHPVVWRFCTGVGLFYWCFCTFLLFQNVEDIRRIILPALDPTLTGEALPERTYGEECELTWGNIKHALFDEFVIAHALGWVFKAMAFRDVWMSHVLSILFELLEYTFVYIQPNFNECWWDHWILDFAICNTGGIIVGHWLMRYLGTKEYSWGGIRDSGKVVRALQQFTPYSWTPYEWHMFDDFRRFAYVLVLAAGVMIMELDAFFLKDIFHVPPPSRLNVIRLVIWWPISMVGLRDFYAFMTNSNIKRLGTTAWVMLATLITEFLVVLKFGAVHYKGKTMPSEIAWAWTIALGLATFASVAWFGYILPTRRAAIAVRNNGNNKKRN